MWIRTCQECGHKQTAKPPTEYKSDAWRNLRCRKCGSPALDYGSESDVDDPMAHWGNTFDDPAATIAAIARRDSAGDK